MYYKMSTVVSDVQILKNFTGSGLYDKSFLDLCRRIKDPVVSFFQIISTLGYDIVKLEYVHQSRKKGKTKNNLFSLFNIAITRVVTSSNIAPRFAIMIGFFLAILSFIIGVIYLIFKLLYWDLFSAGMVPVLIGVFFLGAIQIFLIGLVGEYVVTINQRVMKRPLVVEKERLNFINESEQRLRKIMNNKISGAIRHNESVDYPTSAPFDPDKSYPETEDIPISDEQNGIYTMVRECFSDLKMDKENIGTAKWSPLSELVFPGDTVVIKPNLVINTSDYKIQECTTTHPSILRPVIDYCWKALNEKGKIIVGDASSAEANFEEIVDRTGIGK